MHTVPKTTDLFAVNGQSYPVLEIREMRCAQGGAPDYLVRSAGGTFWEVAQGDVGFTGRAPTGRWLTLPSR